MSRREQFSPDLSEALTVMQAAGRVCEDTDRMTLYLPVLMDFHGITYEQMARAMGISVRTFQRLVASANSGGTNEFTIDQIKTGYRVISTQSSVSKP